MTTRAVVLADTHMPRMGRSLPRCLEEHLWSVDLIVHLGDFTGLEVALSLERRAPLLAVHGNNDSEEIRERYPVRRDVMIEGHRFTLIHGHLHGRTAITAARSVEDADAVLFGHSHRGWCSMEGGRLLFNPGSPTERRWSPFRSFGVLTVGSTIEARIVPISD